MDKLKHPMVDTEGVIQWWDEWQLRILVLGSLALQWFLLLTAPMRKYHIHFLLRKCIWLAFKGSDALAIYALATLFSRHAGASSSCHYAGMASTLEVLWAPILLVHLAGRDEITAVNIEDNEQWTRHTVTLVSQVTIALYAFCKSWPSGNDRKMLMAAIMLFVCGIINFREKPLALRSASFNHLVAMSRVVTGERRKLSLWERCFPNWRWGHHQPEEDRIQMILSDKSIEAATSRRVKQDFGIVPSPGISIDSWLRKTFELIYTRANVSSSPAFCALNYLLVPALHLTAIVLFAKSQKQGYNDDTDIKITYFLMCFTAVLSVLGPLISKLIYTIMALTSLPPLCLILHGCSLISLVIKRTNCSTRCRVNDCAATFDCSCRQVHSLDARRSMVAAEFVVYELLMAHNKVDYRSIDPVSYRSLKAGHNWVLGKLVDYVLRHTPVKRALCDLPFDESVLVWHIATDLCFRAMEINVKNSVRISCIEAISNYMTYLLKFRPEMLMTGSRKNLFRGTMEDLEELLLRIWSEKDLAEFQSEKTLAELIIQKGSTYDKEANNHGDDTIETGKKYNKLLIKDACELAEVLLKTEDATRWKLMYGVWTGMLCYSASMCRGYLHAKALGDGGEFLSFVWMVLSLKGSMRTLADKSQMPQLIEQNEGPVQMSL